MRKPIIQLRAALAIVAVGLAGTAVEAGGVNAAGSSTSMAAIPGSYLPTKGAVTGSFHSSRMSVEVVLQPSNQAGLASLMTNLYKPGSAQYGDWLAQGQFQRDFAPTAANLAAVKSYLISRGLSVQSTSSAFLLRAVGTSAQIDATFDTAIDNYRAANGTAFFSNTAAASLPKTLASAVLGVVGLTNTVRLQPMAQVAGTSAAGHSSEPSCEVPYPQTLAQLQAITAPGQPFNGYGGGPGCSGLTPSQTNSLYNAPHVGPRGQGAGANVAVFELSAYTASDITNWAHTFYGPSYNPPLKNINVDGGPTTPGACPTGDTCIYGYGGDIEVEADIEEDLQIAPDVNQLLVYNSPNDFTGQTELDQYTAIANQDKAELDQLQLGAVRAGRRAGLRRSRESRLRADGGAGAEHVRLVGRHGCLRVHQGRHVRRLCPPPVTRSRQPAVGDERRRYVLRELRPRQQPTPALPERG